MKPRLLPLLLFLLLPFLGLRAQQYLVHTSGHVLGLGSDSRAVLQNASTASPLRFEQQADGSLLVCLDQADGKPLYLQLGTENGWSTFWRSTTNGDRSLYTLETQGNYVRLKNKQTGRYLGTDSNDANSSCFSDKDGNDAKHRWRLSDTPNPAPLVEEYAYPILTDAQRQICEGWGVSLCWWAGQCGKWSKSKLDELLKWMVSPTGLNWNLFRYNIGGGDDPQNRNCTPHHMDWGKGHRAEMEGFQDERGGEYHWERDEAQRRIMLRIKELRPDAQFEAFSNSCPWWMTESGCVSGSSDGNSDNLRKDYYADFAHYLVDVCKHYKDEYGIEFKTLEPFNEANTGYWKQSGQQEGCHVSPQSQVAFLKVLLPILKESGLKTRVSASDETNVGGAIGEFNEYAKSNLFTSTAYQDANKMPLITQWNTHTYGADTRSRSQMGSLARAKGLTMWMSETGSGGNGIAGNLAMSKRLFDDVRYIAPDAWIDWQYMEEKNDQWCMVQGSFDGTNHKRVKNYYVRQQVTRFIKPGYTFVTTLHENCLAALNTAPVSVASASAPVPSASAEVPTTPDTLIVCLLNEGDKAIHHLTLPMAVISGTPDAYRTSSSESLRHLAGTSLSSAVELTSDSTLTVTLPSQSLTTLLLPVTLQAPCPHYYPALSAPVAQSASPSLPSASAPLSASRALPAASQQPSSPSGSSAFHAGASPSPAPWQPTALANRTLVFVPGDTYMIIPQSNTVMAVTDTGSGLALQPARLDDPAQRWTLEYNASATLPTWRLRSGLGRYATCQPSAYALKTQTSTSSAQLFSIESVDGLYCRIMQRGSDKAWDLSNASLSSGTPIGIYTYGSTAQADHRQWLFARVATAHTDDPEETGIHDAVAESPLLHGDSQSPTASPAYDLTGRPVDLRHYHGIAVVNGRKVIR